MRVFDIIYHSLSKQKDDINALLHNTLSRP
jgi:hypothetical protein